LFANQSFRQIRTLPVNMDIEEWAVPQILGNGECGLLLI